MGHFVVLGQFVARKVPVKQCFFMSASVGHFVAGEEMGHFVAGTICHMGRKWDILSSGTICRPKNAGGTICCWDKMSPNRNDQLPKFLHQMCDILDTISLNRLFQLRLHGQWEPYKVIWVKSLSLDQMLGYLEQENVVFGLTPCHCLV